MSKKFSYKPHPFSPEIESKVFQAQGGKCNNCGTALNLRFDRPDHIIAQTKMNVRIYGEERIQSEENCQIPCLKCHTNKFLWCRDKINELKEKWKKFSKSKINVQRAA